MLAHHESDLEAGAPGRDRRRAVDVDARPAAVRRIDSDCLDRFGRSAGCRGTKSAHRVLEVCVMTGCRDVVGALEGDSSRCAGCEDAEV